MKINKGSPLHTSKRSLVLCLIGPQAI